MSTLKPIEVIVYPDWRTCRNAALRTGAGTRHGCKQGFAVGSWQVLIPKEELLAVIEDLKQYEAGYSIRFVPADFSRVCERAAEYANRKKGGLEAAERFIKRTGFKDGIFGIETATVKSGDDIIAAAEYINTGDTYETTVLVEQGGTFCEVGTWGNWVESIEQEYCQENDSVQCGYCGDFTPSAEDWRDTICESCGRNVSTGELC